MMGHGRGEALKSTLRLAATGASLPHRLRLLNRKLVRPGDEVNFTTPFERVLQKELRLEKNRSVRFLGDLDALLLKLQELIGDAIERTAANDGIHFNVCTNYGGRREPVRVAQRLARQAANGDLMPEDIDENSLAAELFTAGEQDPNLLIRTSGEHRISNFSLAAGLCRDLRHRGEG